MSSFAFIEYSFNPSVIDKESIYVSLNKMGFVHRSQHRSSSVGFWIQNSSIVVLKESSVATQGITGMGLLVDQSLQQKLDLPVDPESGLRFMQDPAGFNLYLFCDSELNQILDSSYEVVDRKAYNTPGLEYFSGMIYNNSSPAIQEFYKSIGFKITKIGAKYVTMVTSDNRFSLLLSKHKHDNTVPSVICDTLDVFHTTSCFAVNNVPMRSFDISKFKLDFGHKLNYRIRGYNCAAFGNENSYTIENYVDSALPGVDLIFRTRKQYLHIAEQTLNFYDQEQKKSHQE
jgi:hypothetical protein